MTKLITLDFETYYSRDFSLSKMSLEDYVTDPRFQVIGVGFKVHDRSSTYWIDGTRGMVHMRRVLELLDIQNSILVCQNTMFDALILGLHFDIKAKLYADTMLMANPLIRPFSKRVSLKAIGETLKLPTEKGDEVVNALGKRLEDFTHIELQRYGAYCKNDVEMTYNAFRMMAPLMPKEELRVIDKTLRMYLQPKLSLDPEPLHIRRQEVIEENARLLAEVEDRYTKIDLRSNPRFAQALRDQGVEPPTKISPLTNKETYAFSKQDQEFMDLLEHPNPYVQALVAARLANKSSIEETRCTRLIEISERHGHLRVPLLYYGAHTGRYSGTQKINLQNLNSKGGIRNAIIPLRDDEAIWAADYSQIEARITAALAGQEDLVKAFADGEDVYASFATEYYKRPITKDDNPEERFFGKTCILGLGFGMGAPKFHYTANLKGMTISEDEAYTAVAFYRSRYAMITQLWGKLDILISKMASAPVGELHVTGCLTFAKEKVILPNGMTLVYHNLRRVSDGKGGTEWLFEHAGETKRLWGSKLLENIVQALAQIVVKHAMLRVEKKFGDCVALQVHDELIGTCKRKGADKFLNKVMDEMRSPPVWMPELPIEVEGRWASNYGDAK